MAAKGLQALLHEAFKNFEGDNAVEILEPHEAEFRHGYVCPCKQDFL